MAKLISVVVAILCLMVSSRTGVDGQEQAEVTIILPNGNTVSEVEGTIQYCARVTGRLTAAAELRIQSADISGADENVDFERIVQSVTFQPSPNMVQSQCFNAVILQDNVVEGDENFALLLIPSSDNIGQNTQTFTLTITDSNNLEVSFSEETYSVREEDQTISVCAMIVNGSLASDADDIRFGITPIVTNRTTAQGGADFQANLGQQQFVFFSETGNSVSCVNIGILQDGRVEDMEEFYLMFVDIEGLTEHVEYLGNTTRVVIQNSDSASVSLRPTQLSREEGNHSMLFTHLFCAELFDTKDGVDRDIVLELATREGSATEDDYQPVRETLTFPMGSREGDEVCVNVTIIGDNVSEEDEMFMVVLTLRTPDEVMGSTTASISILDDGDVNACRILDQPTNGRFSEVEPGNNPGARVTYSCSDNFRLVGPMVRTCEVGGWTGDDPKCLAICRTLGIVNGQVSVTGMLEGDNATYVCMQGFLVNGNSSRTCQSNGEWSGEDPTCQRVQCQELPNPTNGVVIYNPNRLYGSQAIYLCNQGFAVVSGNNVRMCQANGEWSGVAGICRRGPPSSGTRMGVFTLLSTITIAIFTCVLSLQ